MVFGDHFPMPVALSCRAGSSNQPVEYLDHQQTLVQIDPQAVASNPRFDWREHHISRLFPLRFYHLRLLLMPLLLSIGLSGFFLVFWPCFLSSFRLF